jgi:hypothetical protein
MLSILLTSLARQRNGIMETIEVLVNVSTGYGPSPRFHRQGVTVLPSGRQSTSGYASSLSAWLRAASKRSSQSALQDRNIKEDRGSVDEAGHDLGIELGHAVEPCP